MLETSSSPFQRLAAKGAQGQWSAADIRGWDDDVAALKWLPRKFQAALISQFYYSEQATSRICRKLLDTVPDPEAQRCLQFQIADEERHAQVYRRYLSRLGDITPPEAAMEDAFEEAFSWSGPPEGLICAFNIILEGEALRALEEIGRWLKCPLFRRINAPICRDEARHFAFGRIYLACALKALERDQRLDIYRWLKGLWQGTTLGTLDRFRIPGLITRRRRRDWAADGWQGHRSALIGVGLLSHEEARLAEGMAP